MKEEFGEPDRMKLRAVGYGINWCSDWDKERDKDGNCIKDEIRRYADLEITLPRSKGFTNGDFEPPMVWCSKASNVGPAGQIPDVWSVRGGDSGGPWFVRALDGRWIFVGYSSGGNNEGGCASSLLANYHLYREAQHSVALTKGHNDLPNDKWRHAQLKIFFADFFESWSSPNGEALKRLQFFYYGYWGMYLDGKHKTFPELYHEKKKFAERWPLRKYRPMLDTMRSSCNERGRYNIWCAVKLMVEWTVESSERNERKRGVAEYQFELNTAAFYSNLQEDFGQGVSIFRENSIVVSRQ
jgi:hypothetical protein